MKVTIDLVEVKRAAHRRPAPWPPAYREGVITLFRALRVAIAAVVVSGRH